MWQVLSASFPVYIHNYLTIVLYICGLCHCRIFIEYLTNKFKRMTDWEILLGGVSSSNFNLTVDIREVIWKWSWYLRRHRLHFGFHGKLNWAVAVKARDAVWTTEFQLTEGIKPQIFRGIVANLLIDNFVTLVTWQQRIGLQVKQHCINCGQITGHTGACVLRST